MNDAGLQLTGMSWWIEMQTSDDVLAETINGVFKTDACRKLAIWRYDCNNVRLHSSLGRKSPAQRAPGA